MDDATKELDVSAEVVDVSEVNSPVAPINELTSDVEDPELGMVK